MSSDITAHEAYNACAPDDFHAMVVPERYMKRDPSFDGIIAKTHDHFWDPLNPKYVDFTKPFDVDSEPIMPLEHSLELQSAVADRLDERQRVQFANEGTRWLMSAILHGEQGAMALSASLCHILLDPGAQEYAANQTREEARHVTAFAEYIKARWGLSYPCSTGLMNLLDEIVYAPEVYKKIVGMQLLVEGLAMGAFARIFHHTNDPVLKQMIQFVMTDEAFHHKFGKIWADRTVPNLGPEHRATIEDWALKCFTNLFMGQVDFEQKQRTYDRFGLDWQWVRDAVAEARESEDTDARRREAMRENTSMFRVLTKTLLNAGIITERTQEFYERFVNLEELRAEGERMIGDDIAEEGIEQLQKINQTHGETKVTIAAE